MIRYVTQPPGPSALWFTVGAAIDIAIIAAIWWLGRRFGLWQFIREFATPRRDTIVVPRRCDWTNCDAEAEPYLLWCLYHYQVWQRLNVPPQ